MCLFEHIMCLCVFEYTYIYIYTHHIYSKPYGTSCSIQPWLRKGGGLNDLPVCPTKFRDGVVVSCVASE